MASQDGQKLGKSHASKGSKKDMRPLSGNVSQKQFTKHAEARSRAQNQHHNMSMFDKIGGSGKQGQSPPGPIDFHGKQQLNQHHLKPMQKVGHN